MFAKPVFGLLAIVGVGAMGYFCGTSATASKSCCAPAGSCCFLGSPCCDGSELPTGCTATTAKAPEAAEPCCVEPK